MANPHHDKALKYFKKEKFDESLKAFNKALEEEPNNPIIYNERGVLYFHMKEKMKSLADMNKSVELQPDYAFWYSCRAYIKDSLGDLEGAIKDYEKSTELDPENSVTWNNLGHLQEKLGRKQAAERYYQRADKLAKIEEELYAKMDELEGKANPNENPANKVNDNAPTEAVGDTQDKDAKTTIIASDEITPAKDQAKKGRIIKSVLTKKSDFKEFIRFVRNGFKLK